MMLGKRNGRVGVDDGRMNQEVVLPKDQMGGAQGCVPVPHH